MTAPTDRVLLALYRIVGAAGGHCEADTSGIGACWRNGRDPDAVYGADRVCNACLAWDALHPQPVNESAAARDVARRYFPEPEPGCQCSPPGSGLYHNPDVILPADATSHRNVRAQFPTEPATWACPHCGTTWNAPVRISSGQVGWVRASAGLG